MYLPIKSNYLHIPRLAPPHIYFYLLNADFEVNVQKVETDHEFGPGINLSQNN
jgi:hypothetical protein